MSVQKISNTHTHKYSKQASKQTKKIHIQTQQTSVRRDAVAFKKVYTNTNTQNTQTQYQIHTRKKKVKLNVNKKEKTKKSKGENASKGTTTPLESSTNRSDKVLNLKEIKTKKTLNKQQLTECTHT